MILATVIISVLGLLFTILFAITLNEIWLGILWLCGLIYALSYFVDVLKFGEVVKDIDRNGRKNSIRISKAYLR